MPVAFLNHKSEEKKVVKEIASFLNSCLIETWLDEEKIHPGKKLLDTIYGGLGKSAFFIACLSKRYLTSDWCMRELESACLKKGKINLIPVLLESKNDILKLSPDWVQDLLTSTAYLEFDKYDIPYSASQIVKSIWDTSPVRFEPIRIINIGPTDVQLIHYDTASSVPVNLFKTWDFNIENFISTNNGKDNKIIIDLPVAFSGISINWLISHLVIKFHNKRDVLVFNQRSGELVCIYTKDQEKGLLKEGDTFPIKL